MKTKERIAHSQERESGQHRENQGYVNIKHMDSCSLGLYQRHRAEKYRNPSLLPLSKDTEKEKA
jgi:hypothetical protein